MQLKVVNLIFLARTKSLPIKFKIISFHLYIYPPDSQESDGSANTEGKQLPRPAFGDAKILLSA